jgi:predicted GNAT superfamily acetyltransferase
VWSGDKKMNKDRAIALNEEANRVAEVYCNPERQYNTQKEVFLVKEIRPLSESTAVVYSVKTSGKIAICFFIWIKDQWEHFFPTDSHVLGMIELPALLRGVEQANFVKNFEKQKEISEYI